MKVGELIKRLQEFDPDDEVAIDNSDGEYGIDVGHISKGNVSFFNGVLISDGRAKWHIAVKL